MTTAALVLSGGEASPLGGSPTAMVPVGSITAVRRIVGICLADGFDPIVVVVGAHRGPIAHDLRDVPITLVVAEDWREGRTASMQAGLGAIPEDRDILFWPVDRPFAAEATVDRLVAAREADPLSVWWIPAYGGRGGDPVLWRSTMRRDLLELRPDAPIRSLLPEYGPQVHHIAVDDPGVVASTDTPESLRASLEAWRQREGA